MNDNENEKKRIKPFKYFIYLLYFALVTIFCAQIFISVLGAHIGEKKIYKRKSKTTADNAQVNLAKDVCYKQVKELYYDLNQRVLLTLQSGDLEKWNEISQLWLERTEKVGGECKVLENIDDWSELYRDLLSLQKIYAQTFRNLKTDHLDVFKNMSNHFNLK